MTFLKKILFLSFFLSSFLIVEIKAQSEDSTSEKKFTIGNCVNEFNREGAVDTKVGYQYWFVDKEFLDGRTLKMSVVAPHQATHAPHHHSEDEFFFVLEGTAEFYLNGKTKIAGPSNKFLLSA